MLDSNKLIICPDVDTLAVRAADLIVHLANEAIQQRGRFTLVLSGGTTPERTYQRLASSETAAKIDWSKTCLFFGDERFVPPQDSVSNFGMARRSLLDHVPVPQENVFPVPTACESADKAADRYGETIARFFGLAAGTAPPPRFDLILLGLGDDGHTASLFPGMPALEVNDAWVTASPPGTLPPPVDRITLTFPIINQARHVLFLAAGEKKANVVHEILECDPSLKKYPAAGVRPSTKFGGLPHTPAAQKAAWLRLRRSAGKIGWLLDEGAAKLLTPDLLRLSSR